MSYMDMLSDVAHTIVVTSYMITSSEVAHAIMVTSYMNMSYDLAHAIVVTYMVAGATSDDIHIRQHHNNMCYIR
jgi:HSP20 family molecular chaperone IbpA